MREIAAAEHYIYIEQQFFISVGAGDPVRLTVLSCSLSALWLSCSHSKKAAVSHFPNAEI